MANARRSSGLLSKCLILALCAGAAVWAVCPEWVDDILGGASSSVQTSAPSVPSPAGDASAPAGEGKDAAATSAGGQAGGKFSPQEVAAPLDKTMVTAEEPAAASAPADPQEERLARVEKALAETAQDAPSAVEKNGEPAPEVSGKVEEEAPVPEAPREDSVVSGSFVSDLARWMASHHVPASREGAMGRSTATFVRANGRYSSSPLLRSLESDPLKGRASILRHVLSPGVLESLYLMYGPRLTEELAERAARPVKGVVPAAWRQADLFAVYAGEFREAAKVLGAASSTDVRKYTDAIRDAVVGEISAEDGFSHAYAAHAAAKDAGDRAESSRQSSLMMQYSSTASMYAERQKKVRAAMASALRAKSGASMSDEELVFIGEWLVRHKVSDRSLAMARDIFDRMAGDFEARAASILAPAPAVEAAPVAAEASATPAAVPAKVPAVESAGTPAEAEAPAAAPVVTAPAAVPAP